MPPIFRPRGDRAKRVKRYDRERGTAAERGYDAEWQRARREHLRASPVCRYCEIGAFDGQPRIVAASLVDHFWPHRGDRVAFWRRDWWVSSCKPCHDGPKQALEQAGRRAMGALAARLGLPAGMGGGSKV